MDYNNLLKKLEINNFTLTGEYGEMVLDLITAYSTQANSTKNNFESAKKDLETQSGLNFAAIKKILDLPEEELERIISGSNKFVDSIPEEELPEEYKEGKNKLEKAKKLLEIDKAMPKEKREELQKAIAETEKELLTTKEKLLNKKLTEDPTLLGNNPKMLKALIEVIDAEVPEYKADQKQENLRKIRKQIETNFLIMKGYDEEVVNKIVKGIHDKSLTKKEFVDLLNAIVENDELLNTTVPLFTNTRN